MNNYSRIALDIASDTGPTGVASQADTGPHIWGELHMMRWVPTDGDTGGDLVLTALINTADTGQGWDFFSDNDILNAQFTRFPRHLTSHPEGVDTGRADLARVSFAGERIRAKAVAGQDACSGKLYLWIKH